MARVAAPAQKQDDLGTLLQLGQVGAGLAAGGPMGALTAAQGGVGFLKSQEPQGGAPAGGPGSDGKLEALRRRGDALQQDPFAELQKAQASLQSTSPEFQAKVQPVIEQALAQARAQRGGR
jgi:hypothetical protein